MILQLLRFLRQAAVLSFIFLSFFSSTPSRTKTTTTVFAEAAKVLKQIHVITRHGARTMLAKDADTLVEQGGATLTPLGQEQLYNLGVWLRLTYSTNYTESSHLSLEYYNPALHRLESSDLDRTISSANALAIGLFPSTKRATGISGGSANNNNGKYLVDNLLPNGLSAVPVYTIQEENDIYLRAYRNCPKFHDRLQELYETNEWKQIESSNAGLLEKLGRIFPDDAQDGAIPLKDIWNVYDPIHVALTECDSSSGDSYPSCDALVPIPSLASALSLTDFAKLEVLTEETEHMKFGTDVAGDLLGSNLMWKIVQRASIPNDGTFFLYSAHAPTLLGFLATLQASDDYITASRGERFVDYGSALILEVYQDTDGQSSGNNSTTGHPLLFKLKYKSPEKEEAVDIQLQEGTSRNGVPCGTSGLDPPAEYCTLARFTLWAVEHTLLGAEQWCVACGNEISDVCLREKYAREDGESSGSGSSSSSYANNSDANNSDTETNVLIMVVIFIGGFLAGLIVMAGLFYICKCSKQTSIVIQDPDSKGTSVAHDTTSAANEPPAVSAVAVSGSTFDNGITNATTNGSAIMGESDDVASTPNRKELV